MGRLSRRNLLGLSAAAVAGPSAALLAGCGDDEDTGPSPEAELRALNGVLALELGSIAVYGAGARLLTGSALEASELFAEQEREHADALEEAIEGLGGTPASPLTDEAYREAIGLDRLRDADDFLHFAVDLENGQVALAGAALPKLGSPELRTTVIEIVATEAEHLAVLLGELGEPQVPDSFVAGARARGAKP